MSKVCSWNDTTMRCIRTKRLTSLRNDMARICLWKRYDYEVFTKLYDYYMKCEWRIYICCDMIRKLYEICYGTRYVINWHVYDMKYCDAICYGMICIWWRLLCLEAWNVMIWHIYIIWMIWYDWHAKWRTSMKHNPTCAWKTW